jgi:hypothetical protein
MEAIITFPEPAGPYLDLAAAIRTCENEAAVCARIACDFLLDDTDDGRLSLALAQDYRRWQDRADRLWIRYDTTYGTLESRVGYNAYVENPLGWAFF